MRISARDDAFPAPCRPAAVAAIKGARFRGAAFPLTIFNSTPAPERLPMVRMAASRPPSRGRIVFVDQATTSNGRIMSLSSCSTMWQW